MVVEQSVSASKIADVYAPFSYSDTTDYLMPAKTAIQAEVSRKISGTNLTEIETTSTITGTTTTAPETTTVIDGNWGDWISWTSCSAYCGTGTKYRSRSCDSPPPSGGKDCVGVLTESTSCNAAEKCCAPKVFDVVFLIDKTFYSYMSSIRSFFNNVSKIFEIEPSRTRISAAVVGSTVTLLFNFTQYTSYTDISTSINKITGLYWATANSKDALNFARGTMFTTGNGARKDVSDVLIMLISNVNSLGVEIAAQKLKDNGVYFMVAEEYISTSKLKAVADVYATFSYPSTTQLSTIKTTIAAGFPCNYFCGTSFFALDSPSTLSTGNDSSAGYLYLMTDSTFQVSCCGVTSAWEFFAVNFGTVEIMIFRRVSEHEYYLVGSTQVIVPEEYVNTVVSFTLTSTERIAVVEGDTLGWYTSGPNIIGHADCSISTRSDCPQGNKKLLQNTGVKFATAQILDFSLAENITNRGYSIKVATANNTELTLRPIQNETDIEENTQVGYTILFFGVEDPDQNDNITWVLQGDHEQFTISEMKNGIVTLDLKTQLPPGGGGPYIITVIGSDSCQHSASATVTVSIFNAPPVINNLPFITELSEATKRSVHLYTINVTDSTNDEICCTMSYSLPLSYNFQLKNDNGVYSIWTVATPAFAYNDINSYRIFICCQDPYGSTTTYLFLRITEDKKTQSYTPPDWFYRALIVSLMPIAIMTLLACATLVITMFFLDGEIKMETSPQLIELNSTIISTLPDDENEIEEKCSRKVLNDDYHIQKESKTIEFKNLYNNEVFNIPIWRGKEKQETTNDSETSISTKEEETQNTNRRSYGIEMKLFHFGKKYKDIVVEEERVVQVNLKKNELKEKWKRLLEREKKNKQVKRKPLSTVIKGTEEQHENAEVPDKTENREQRTESAGTADGNMLSIFDEVTPTGRAAKDTLREKTS